MLETVKKLVKQAVKKLRMDRWTVNVEISDAPYGDILSNGAAHINANYKEVTISVRKELDPARYEHVIAHELVHCLLERALGYAVESFRHIPDEALRLQIMKEFDDRSEEVVDDLAFVLKNYLFSKESK